MRERVRIQGEKDPYDKEYYINHQLIPAIENILQVFGINAQEMFWNKKQTTLGDF